MFFSSLLNPKSRISLDVFNIPFLPRNDDRRSSLDLLLLSHRLNDADKLFLLHVVCI